MSADRFQETLPALLVIVAAGIAGAGALFWVWRRLRANRRLSAGDYVAQAKAQAQAELNAYLKSGD